MRELRASARRGSEEVVEEMDLEVGSRWSGRRVNVSSMVYHFCRKGARCDSEVDEGEIGGISDAFR